MIPERHHSNNVTVRPPKGWDDRGGQLELPAIHATQLAVAGVKVFVTHWRPSPDELACLLRDGRIQLSCVGGQPPVNISAVGSPDGMQIILPN